MSRSPDCPGPSPNGSLDVLIVGGGLCGLAMAIAVALSGHRAIVFEAFETTHPFGSGVQLSPNGTRVLSKWGLGDILDPVVTTPRALQIHNLNGEILASRGDYAEEILRRYQFPMWALHRVDLQRGLTRRATDLGVQIQYSSRVVDIDSSNTTITLVNGEERRGDLVVITDGTWSTLRRRVLGHDIAPRTVGYTAYRITVDSRQTRDKELLNLMSSAQSRLWTSQDSYAHCFPIRGGKQLSVLLITTANVSPGTVSPSSAVEELQKLAESWDPLLATMLTAAQRVNKWQLVHVPPLPTMVSPKSTCVLAGDCCHSLHPLLSQGLNLGLEDAATLGQLLSHVESSNQLPDAVELYNDLRADRARKLDDETWAQVEKLRWLCGGLQKSAHGDAENSSDEVQDWVGLIEKEWIWRYDAFEETEKAYANKPF